jgi:hypothetical protein
MLSTCAAHSRTHSTQKTPTHSGAHRDDTSKIGAPCSKFRGAHSSTLITSQHATTSQCTTRYHQSVYNTLPPVSVHVTSQHAATTSTTSQCARHFSTRCYHEYHQSMCTYHFSTRCYHEYHKSMCTYHFSTRCYHEYRQSMCTTAAKAHVQREKKVYYASIVRRMGFASTRQTKKDWVMCGTWCSMHVDLCSVQPRCSCVQCWYE